MCSPLTCDLPFSYSRSFACTRVRFISSENFLVIGGKDMQQNENLVKKYLKAGDAYVHAEIHGASSVIVKNHTSSPIPALTLSQAGSMTICRSNAWKEKVLVQAYWVHADQVSKTPPTGLSLPTGSFMIRGRKNFLPSMPLVMGVGLLWKLDDSCRAKHAGERKVRAAGEEASQPTEEDKFDQIGDLPGAASSSAATGTKASSSSKKKKPSGGGSNKKKPSSSAAAESSPDFDVTSRLGGFRGPTAPTRGSAPPIGRLTSEDEGTDAEEEEKKKRLAQLAEGGSGGGAGAKQPPAGKKKLSVAERKKLKKGGQNTEEPAADAAAEPTAAAAASAPATAASAVPAPSSAAQAAELSSSDDDAAWGAKKKPKKKGRGAKAGAGAAAGSSTAAAAAAPARAAAPAPAKPLPRGKRTKLKRVQDRYKNQDEDDLVLAASLLGLQNVDKKKEEVKAREKQFLQAGKNKEEQAEEDGSDSEEEEEEEKKGEAASSAPVPAASMDDDSSKVCFLCKSRGHVFKSCPSRASAGEDVSLTSLRRAAETAEEGEVARLMAEEGIAAGEDDAAGAADSAAQAELELSGLTGRPLSDDLLHFALPVCAPYDALAGYKFKLKLLPGAAKKGKAAKQALQLYMATAQVTPQETDLLKLVPEQELINVLLSNIKLSYPGQQDGKKKTKNKPKATPGGASSSSSAKAGAAADDD